MNIKHMQENPSAGNDLGISATAGWGPKGIMPHQGSGSWIGDHMGEPSPMFPSMPMNPGSPFNPSPPVVWPGIDWVQRQAKEQARKDQEERERRESQEALARLIRNSAVPDGKEAAAKKRAEQARGFGEGVEQAKGALGARHHFREALAAGHALGMRRCWSAVVERSFEADVLGSGKSETLMAAALGSGPRAALDFLLEVGFAPGVPLASQAMLAALAAGSPAEAFDALIEGFGAGSLSESVLAELEKRGKGLSSRARAKGETHELGEAALPAPAAPLPARRL